MSSTPSAAGSCPAELTNFCAERHWALYWIIIVCALVSITGNVMRVGNDGSPFMSANDRSRWCTISALVDFGTYEIDEVLARESRLEWDSIDKVRHVGEDGQFHFYSSKPTLWPTLLAGQYQLIKGVTGWTLNENPRAVVRTMLVLNNVFLFGVLLYFLAHLIDAVGVRDWTRYFVLAVAGFGTFLSTFSVTLNNHLPAAVCTMIALYGLFWIWKRDFEGNLIPQNLHGWWFAVVGFFGAFAVACELPALAFFAFCGVFCLLRSPSKTFLLFVPVAILVAAAFFTTNHLAHGDWRPAYGHRSDGRVIAVVQEELSAQLDSGQLPASIAKAIEVELKLPVVSRRDWPGDKQKRKRWVVRQQTETEQFAIVQSDNANEFSVCAWNNWYDYPGSYWFSDKRSGVDQGQPDQLLYLFHLLFGHHGIFSLTPVWLLSFAGFFVLIFDNRLRLRWLGVAALAISIVVIAFYFRRPEIDRNYGGMTSGLRWVFWLAPVWIVGMLPIVDWLGRNSRGRWLCFLLLAASALSALYSIDNPWVHPWLYEVWDSTGLPK